MLKQETRKLFQEVVKETDKITLKFVGSLSHINGTYICKENKVGRGKGGMCRILTLTLEKDDSKTFNLSTKDHNEIVSLEHNGTVYGSSKDERKFPGNMEVHNQIKSWYNEHQTKEDWLVSVKSSEPTYNGLFTLTSMNTMKGRWGQVVLHLVNKETGEQQELWSYKHSGVIESIEFTKQQ